MQVTSAIIIIGGIFITILGYLMAFKFKYKLIATYQYTNDSDRYPIEIEKRYCRNMGIPCIIMGAICVITPFISIYSWWRQVIFAVLLLLIVYTFTIPNYRAKRELKKLSEN